MTGERHVFEYALVRVVPRVDRGESINAGVLLYCKSLDFLGSRYELDVARLAALDASCDPDAVGRSLAAATDTALNGHESIGARFRWLTAPRSTVVQPGPVHTGLTSDPRADLDRLFACLVLPVSS